MGLMRHALGLMRHALGLMRHALGLMRHALGLMRHALGLMRHARSSGLDTRYREKEIRPARRRRVLLGMVLPLQLNCLAPAAKTCAQVC
jgi:hypothetical protein